MYVSLVDLANVSGISAPNLVFATFVDGVERASALTKLTLLVQSFNLKVVDISSLIQQNTHFLQPNWQTIMHLPLLTLVSAALCLVGYMMLALPWMSNAKNSAYYVR